MKLPYANTDPSLHFNHSEPQKPDWRQEYIQLLKSGDESAAHELRLKHDASYAEGFSDECLYGDHDLCTLKWCVCVHHSENQFKLQHPHLRSLAEVEASREESEAA